MSNRNDNTTDPVHELAPLYALDGLDLREKQQFEDHLRAGCDLCSAELRHLQSVASAVACSVAAEPPAKLRDRLMARVARTPRTPGLAFQEGGLLIARSQEIEWKTMAPGISYKPLHSDSVRNSDTMLIRMEPGSSYPSHRHAQVEELFLLSGDLVVENQAMYAGDYCRADLGTVHNQSFTEGGCLFLLMASPDNQVMA